MAKEKHVSATPATDWLKAHKVNFKLHTYDFVPHGGTGFFFYLMLRKG